MSNVNVRFTFNYCPPWRYSQMIGVKSENLLRDFDISSLAFSPNGNKLAYGDHGGRVNVLQYQQTGNRGYYMPLTEFYSHDEHIVNGSYMEQEKNCIQKLSWLSEKNSSHLLSTSNKVIKLWKIDGKLRQRVLQNYKHLSFDTDLGANLNVELAQPVCRRVFPNVHRTEINALSVNSDQENFLSADYMNVYLWNFEVSHKVFNIVVFNPQRIRRVSEEITTAIFHASKCNVFVYSSTFGSIRLCDMRSSALCDKHAKLFQEISETEPLDFDSQIIRDMKFSRSGELLLARQYSKANVWDLRMEKKPVESYDVQKYLNRIMNIAMEKVDVDRFECCWSNTDDEILTGSYGYCFKIFNRSSKKPVLLEAIRLKFKPNGIAKQRWNKPRSWHEFEQVTSCVDWHPKKPLIAVAAADNLFLYEKTFLSSPDSK